MRDSKLFDFNRALPRMSWGLRNLYNLWRRTQGDKAAEITFTRTSRTLFQQRWVSKAVVRAYHGDFINEKVFKRWYLPSMLPDVRPRSRSATDDTGALMSFARRIDQAQKEQKLKAEEDSKGVAPVGSLMFSEVERRIDVFIFRCCFAHSVYEARRLVIHGYVKLNGKKHDDCNTRLAPGDMVSVDPSAIRFLSPPSEKLVEADGKAENENDLEDDSPKPSDAKAFLTPFHLPPYSAPFLFIPAYIEVSFPTCSAIYVRHPTARPGYSEIPTPYDADGEVIRLAWEWYAKVRPRLRSKTQLARMPENRQ